MCPRKKSEESFQDELDAFLLRHIFTRPPNVAPKHPIYSSPFARRISESAFGPKKPKWYKKLTTTQRHQFSEILQYVEVGREGSLHLGKFLKALQNFDPTISRSEVTDILYDMEVEEPEGIDFGKFLFLLAYKDEIPESSSEDSDNTEEKQSLTSVTSRQRLILSAIASFVLTSSLDDVDKYYSQNKIKKSAALHQHLETIRLSGLSEKEMEMKQKKINKRLRELYLLTGSPYTQPVPLAKSVTKKIHGGPKRKTSKYGISETSKSIVTYKNEGNLELDSEEEKLVREINYGKISLPKICLRPEILQQLENEGYTVEIQDYIIEKADEAKQKFRNRLKEAERVYAKGNIRPLLKDGFPTKTKRDAFLEIYQRYLPLKKTVEKI